MEIIGKLKDILSKEKTKQVIALYSATVANIFITLGISVINTRLLGPQGFGDMRFVINAIMFFPMILFIGIFITGNNVIALNRDKERFREIVGALMYYVFLFYVLLCICMLIFSYVEHSIFKKDEDLGWMFRLTLPLLFVIPLQSCLNGIMMGENMIYSMSFYRVLPNLLYFGMAYLTYYIYKFNVIISLYVHFLSMIIVSLYYVWMMKPTMRNYKEHVVHIWEKNKEYGFNMYLGSLISTGSVFIGNFAISYFFGNRDLGLYSLAVNFATPLALIPNVVGTVFFKNFTMQKEISRKVTLSTFAISVSALILLQIFIEPIVYYLYTDKFKGAIPLTTIVCFATFLHGYGDYLNKFMQAHSKGKEIRNSALATGITNVFLYIIMVYYLGAKGAAYTKLIAAIIYFFSMYYYYKRMVKELKCNVVVGK